MLVIAAREARETSRRARAFHARTLVAGLAFCGLLSGLWLASSDGAETQGNYTFFVVSIVAQCYALFAGPIAAADAISSERRENTLGLLFLTDQKPIDILAGKLLACATTAFFGLAAMLPLLAVPILLGGVAFERVALMSLAVVLTLLLSTLFGILCSTIFRQGWTTVGFALVTMFVAGILYPLGLVLFLDGHAELVLFPSPSAAVIVLLDPANWMPRVYLQSIAVTIAAAAACLLIASGRMRSIWREVPQPPAAGNGQAHRRFRKKLLDHNPLAWLANRDRVSSPGLLAFYFICFASILIVWPLSDWSSIDDIIALSSLTLALAHLVLFFRICVAAAHPVAEDRRSGALELLLSTSLDEKEFVRGRWLALARRFFGPVVLLISAELAFLALVFFNLGGDERASFLPSLSAFELSFDQNVALEEIVIVLLAGANWIAAGWLGMWFGLRRKTPAGAVWATFCAVALPPLFVVGGILLAAALVGLVDDFSSDFVLTAALCALYSVGLAHAGMAMRRARKNLQHHLRAAAADRGFEPPRIVPWPAIRRFAGATVTAILICGVGLWIWRREVNRRGENAWREIEARFPVSALERAPTGPDRVPAHLNLAESPLLLPYIGPQIGHQFGASEPPPRWIDFVGSRTQMRWQHCLYLELQTVERDAESARAIRNTVHPFSAGDSHRQFDPFFSALARDLRERPLIRVSNEARQRLLHMSAILAYRAAHRYRAGETGIDEILLILRFAEGFKQDTEFLSRALQPIYEGIGQHRFGANDLRECREALARIDLWAAFQTRIDEEMARAFKGVEEDFNSWRERSSAYSRLLAAAAPDGWLREEQAHIARAGFEMFPRVFDAKNRRIHLEESFALRDYRPALRLFVPYRVSDQLLWSAREFARTQTGLDHARIACDLESFWLERGCYPDALDEKFPRDLFSGEPMRYSRAEDGQSYLLSSIGWDGRDDGGRLAQPDDVRPHRIEPCGDWVWRPFPKAALP